MSTYRTREERNRDTLTAYARQRLSDLQWAAGAEHPHAIAILARYHELTDQGMGWQSALRQASDEAEAAGRAPLGWEIGAMLREARQG